MLSDKPSEAIRQALDDLAKCEADPRYHVDMGEWVNIEHGVCCVCLAGAVMAQEHGPYAKWRMVIDYRHYGLDQFRAGRIWGGIAHFREKVPQAILSPAPRVEGIPEYFPITDYEHSPSDFRRDMLGVIVMLERIGL